MLPWRAPIFESGGGGGWPGPPRARGPRGGGAGRGMARGGLSAPEEFARALDAYLKAERVRVRELWAAAGGGPRGAGALGPAALGSLVREVLPQAAPAAAGLLQALADSDGDGQVTLEEFGALVHRAGELARGGASAELLRRVAAAFEKDLLWARQAFNDSDQDEDGFLEIYELPGLLRDVMPGLSAEDAQCVVLHAYEKSAKEDKRLTLTELKQVLGVGLKQVQGGGPSRPTHGAQARQGGATASTGPGAAPAAPSLGPWRLRRQIIAGKKYIVDPSAGKVFLPAEGSRRLTFVGVLEGGKLHRADSCAKLFDTIDIFLSVNKLSLQELWREHDASGVGLDPQQMGTLLQEVMPSITPKQARYFATMMDVDGGGRVTLEEMLQSIKQCKGLGVDLARQESFGIEDILFKLAAAISDGQVSLWEVFRRFDGDDSGELDRSEVAAMVRAVVPGLSRKEVRHILAHAQQLDTDGNGQISYPELMKALQMVSTEITTTEEYQRFEEEEARERELEQERERARTSRPSPRAQRAVLSPTKPGGAGHGRRTPSRPPKAPEAAPRVEWDLERVVHEGQELLLERSSGRLFRQDRASGAIEAVGRYRGSRVEAPARLDLFGALDRHLKEHDVRLKALFEQFGGAAGGGALGRDGLVRLVRRLLPQASEAQARYFGAMMDLDGDGQVTVEELLRTVKAFRDKGASLVAPAPHEASAELHAALDRLRAALRAGGASLWDAFCHFDRDGSGELELPELVELVRAVAPGLDAAEQRRVCFHLGALDVDGNGGLSYGEVAKALGACEPFISASERQLEAPPPPGKKAAAPAPRRRRAGVAEPGQGARDGAQAARRAAAQRKREAEAAEAAQARAEEEALHPGAAARRRMDRCNGARAHVRRVQPKHISRRHELMAALQRGVEAQRAGGARAAGGG